MGEELKERERKTLAESPLSAEPNMGLNLATVRLQPEPNA